MRGKLVPDFPEVVFLMFFLLQFTFTTTLKSKLTPTAHTKPLPIPIPDSWHLLFDTLPPWATRETQTKDEGNWREDQECLAVYTQKATERNLGKVEGKEAFEKRRLGKL
ncbi:uncharacterized protein C8R40DRAFT_1073966 [Lentinula edodes]|uniref:uncharacterized protein n=1 Tax=Lentinula edodes TaxID=5353 RepID=UPI001E8D58DB|nr:uncharacterized protein C8R40DRAFT_1073966 [Lentinula edodes]KAH7869658.1 hypothetical protein C8R40DRAFT_1073966 [Lentinula edodes]